MFALSDEPPSHWAFSAKQELQYLEQQEKLQDIDTTLASFMQRLAEGHIKTQDLIRDEATTVRQTVLKQGQDTIYYIDREFRTNRKERLDGEQYQRLLGSLRFPEMNSRRNQIADSHETTFEWIYDDSLDQGWSPFTAFLQGNQKTYWIRGKAGSGKSCLMRFLCRDDRTINALRVLKRQGPVRVLSHFFWRPGSEMQKCPKGFLLSIVYQLLEILPDLASVVLSEDQRLSHHQSTDDWSERELLGVFKRLAALRDADTLCIFVDGLDEVDQEYGHWNSIQLINDLASLHNVKLCVSSRPEAEFKIHLEVHPRLKLEDLTREDMRKLARDMLQDAFQGYLKRPEPATLDDLVDTTVEKAEGVFLWATYALKSLRRGLLGRDNWPNLQKRLETLPKGIGNLYRAMWERLREDEELWREEAAWYFHFVLESKIRFQNDQTLLALTIARDLSLGSEIIEDQTFDLQDLKSRCVETESQLITRCAGLLDLRISKNDWLGEEYDHNNDKDSRADCDEADCDCLDGYDPDGDDPDGDDPDVMYKSGLMGEVVFIHRSAHEFLREASEGQEIMKHSRLTEEEVLRTRILTQIALVVIIPFKDRRPKIAYPVFFRDIERYHMIAGFEEKALEMLCLFLQVCQGVSRKDDKDCLYMLTGERISMLLTHIKNPALLVELYALEIIGAVFEHAPKLGLSFMEKGAQRRGLSALYANHLTMAALSRWHSLHDSEFDMEAYDVYDVHLSLLRLLFERGADPNARNPIFWGEHYSSSASHMSLILSRAAGLSPQSSEHSLKQVLDLCMEFEWDSKQCEWLSIPDNAGPPLFAFRSLSQSGTTVILEVEIAGLLWTMDLGASIASLITQVCHHHLWKKALLVTNNGGMNMENLSVLEPNVEDTTLLMAAFDQYHTALSEERFMWSGPLWNSIVEPVMEEVKSRAQVVHYEDETITELVRIGFLLPPEAIDIEAYRSEIVRESERVVGEILASTKQEPAKVLMH